MNEASILITLAGVHFVALMSPGPDVALVVQNATRYGRQTGIYIALGLSFGILLHSLLSITGVSYLVHQQPVLFALLQLCGGSYLLYLGFGALKATIANWNSAAEIAPTDKKALLLSNKKQAFSRGFMTNILNPKALVFFVSLMSTLVPASMSVTGKGFALLILWGLSLTWFACLAWMLSTERLQTKLNQASRYIDLLCGVIFSLIGLTILWQSMASFIH
ncbi:LysE family translocator [Vibrio plantisponsor]|uniref:LysE family translocator n=1 Tax=Vibrio plantisponsor TaxID=664643 RepID=A0ABU4IJ10_9VIBR|nr:LysE family translocator [Vibrio plantisponsor]MDW6018553.1 LysE family translocator [Vibrio plantisponsor]NNM42385.1 LysE family translocator [Vibrio plantisponsor]